MRAIDSILGQSHSDLELIVVDDGSTDDTASLVRRAAMMDDRLHYLRLAHIGISQSLNAGMQASRGRFIAFQDADDWSLPKRLERQLDILSTQPEVVAVGCRMQEVDAAGRQLVPRTTFAAGVVNGVLLKFNPIPNSCAMVRRVSALAVGGFDQRYRYAMDYDLWLRLADDGLVATVDEILAVRTMSGHNVAARKERAQTAEAIRIRVATIGRRRAPREVGALFVPLLALATPLALKRRLRRIRGQAP